ncbi:GRAM domain-containing protein 2B-like isoform X1 [Pomacea canaliculata]|uniref:GRAM domain-containing protein 2B-like isoform X1 n=2 Tax=Pomacea canaliculata TaxID=400727 RepID=UPI000D727DAC|nr:GRAM domain-containing protein 2B-like isoform X1 [Pomacea canaliculata]XP_025077138.1 GRAM domain-containing protein 2B-like isoform X1 [Pomacea canaliculata]XP_025077139.1 GRAM domain-containing protein 2B-like isoform X1 [Pomacea canaliculata]XP_025077140.1 GRAM domain-containing protein 2B-like isoform X1 [Pomacea canaliculata]
MTVRRSNSEKMSPEESGTLKEALTPRRSTISTFRKSMPSLLLTKDPSPSADETTVESAEQGSSETHQGSSETRKSGSSVTSGCFISHSLESVAFVPCDNSSPKAAGEPIKVSDSSELPANISKSKNARFHKLFKSVPTDEYPLDSFSCAFKGDILLQGMMYVSQNWICFYSKIRARGRLLEIPLEKVISITREKLALFIPNAIGIQVADQKYVFGSFMSRDNTYKLLLTLLKLSQDTAIKPVRSLCNGNSHEDDITHSADISCESDTTENESDEAKEISEGVHSASAFLQSAELPSAHEKKQHAVRKSPVLSTVRCIDCWKIFTAFSTFAVKIQNVCFRIPRTNLLLAVCCILVLFLFLSAMGLTYKILLLQTQLEMSNLWTPSHQKSFREQVMGSMYTLQSESHMATIHQLHDVLKANIQVLEQVHRSLKSLQGFSTLASSQDCPTKK